MYPFVRLTAAVIRAKYQPALDLKKPHISNHICLPWDLDIWLEMNNGIILSLFDIGRSAYAVRTGLVQVLRQHKWGLAVAGSSVRYRRRVRIFDRYQTRTLLLARDDKFFYLQQSMWRGDQATSSVLYRTAVTDKNGIVPPQKVADAMGYPDWNPPLPEYVQHWIDADATRPWPPEI